eukprot:Pgem_evm1s17360
MLGEQPVWNRKQLYDRINITSNNFPPLEVLILWERIGISMRATMYVEFWLINKCGLGLNFSQSGIGSNSLTASSNDSPLLFSYSNNT